MNNISVIVINEFVMQLDIAGLMGVSWCKLL